MSPAISPIQLQPDLESLLAQCSAYDLLQSAIAVIDTQGNVRYANPAFVQFNKAVRDSINNLGQHATLLECPEFHSWLISSLDSSQPAPLRQIFYYSPKIQVELTVCISCLATPDNKIAGALLTLGEESIAFGQRHLARSQDAYRNLAERIKILNKQKTDNQELLNVLLKDAPIAMVLFNERLEIVQLNHAASILFKTSIAAVRGKPCAQILPCSRQSENCQALNDHTSIKNEIIEVIVSGNTLSLLRSVAVIKKSGNETMIIEAFVDITERLAEEQKRIQYEKQLEALNHELEARVAERTAELGEALEKANSANAAVAYLADHDTMTGMYNRRRFQEELDRWEKYAQRYDRPGVLMFIDLDKFKSINDNYGHLAGDEYLLAVSDLLKKNFRSTDYLGRWGGDEFIVFLPETSTEGALVIASKLLKNLAETTLSIAGHSIHASVSIGIAAMPEHTKKIDELMDFADAAMYQAKGAGRGCYRTYEPLRPPA